jgi:hydroxyacylglutathione hydrolase
VDEGTPIYLVVDAAHVEEAVRSLIRVGLDRVEGYMTPDVLAAYQSGGGELVTTETISMATMESRRLNGQGHVVDVRGLAEFEGEHVPGAIHIPHTRVGRHLDMLPHDKPLLVHCNSGARAAAAVSMLERHGFEAVDVNDLFANYRRADLQVDAVA